MHYQIAFLNAIKNAVNTNTLAAITIVNLTLSNPFTVYLARGLLLCLYEEELEFLQKNGEILLRSLFNLVSTLQTNFVKNH